MPFSIRGSVRPAEIVPDMDECTINDKVLKLMCSTDRYQEKFTPSNGPCMVASKANFSEPLPSS